LPCSRTIEVQWELHLKKFPVSRMKKDIEGLQKADVVAGCCKRKIVFQRNRDGLLIRGGKAEN
jgi:hypothetical protein